MNHRELQDYYLRRMFGQDWDEGDRCEARQEVNTVINDVLGRMSNAPFMYRQADLICPAGENAIVLPFDLVSIVGKPVVDGVNFDLKHPHDFLKAEAEDLQGETASIFFQELTPFASIGLCYPAFGSATIHGVGTAWDGTMTGRIYRAGRDGEVYRIDNVVSTEEMELETLYVGRSQAGRVSVYGDNLRRVCGTPDLNHWTKEMVGLDARVEGVTGTVKINDVDEDDQVLTMDADCVAGTNLVCSVADTFSIDPAGAFILHLPPQEAGSQTDRQVSILYRRAALNMGSDRDSPPIPFNFHHVIQKGLDVRVAINDDQGVNKVQLLQTIFEEAITGQEVKQAVEYPAGDAVVEPEDDPRSFE